MLSHCSDHVHCVVDYMTLVRTRIRDLGGAPFCEGSVNEASELVEQALLEFEHSGRIIPKAIEASIFRAPFYVGSFLPSLLASSEDNVIRKGLIKELNR